MLQEEEHQEAWKEYTATILWSIGKMIGRDEYPMPSYEEFMHPTATDTRTGQDIIGGLVDKLLDKGGESEK